MAVVWCSGSALVLISDVNLHWAQLVLGWVTVSRFNSQCGTVNLVCNQLPRSTQPGHPFTGRCNEYQPKGNDVLQLGSKRKRQVWFVWVAGKNCDPLVIHGGYISAL